MYIYINVNSFKSIYAWFQVDKKFLVKKIGGENKVYNNFLR